MSEIDVSNCDYYFQGRCGVSKNINYSIGCYANDCYYKQLQQLKQENELLKNERTIDLRNQLEQLKAENEELKEIIKKALEDFRGEYGTNDYDRLLVRASKHKIDISDFGEILYGKE